MVASLELLLLDKVERRKDETEDGSLHFVNCGQRAMELLMAI